MIPKEENKIYTMMKGRETFYGNHTVLITSCSKVQYVLQKDYPLEARITPKNWKLLSVQVFRVRLVNFGKLGLISDPQISSKLQNRINDPKGLENKIYTVMKGRETFGGDHTVPINSCSKVQYVL